ncbi:hypothetical protein LNN38_14640 [Pseudomonas sp. LA21]|uniref:Rap1a/Tai family immunity protein n=1 Tax=Pseudomonas sp. LA21 TaxID=2893373 RepID=UPI001FB81A4E|nr:Rap1a/Tai family immunity protein [Pseudomonas sp. LA21]MCJ1886089.1 hypothetical protein [Pseudomonas sp. LA21]
MNIIKTAIISSALYATTVFGSAVDGNHLLSVCHDYVAAMDGKGKLNSPFDRGYCAGMIHGTLDMAASTSDSTFRVCLPPSSVTTSQATRVVVKYLESNPEQLHLRDTELVIMAFQNAFPCKS